VRFTSNRSVTRDRRAILPDLQVVRRPWVSSRSGEGAPDRSTKNAIERATVVYTRALDSGAQATSSLHPFFFFQSCSVNSVRRELHSR
jgi:hypothetical protein